MDDVIALRVGLDNGEFRYFMTWGRVLDVVDPRPVQTILSNCLGQFDLGGVATSVTVCDSLRDAAESKYFFEALFQMSQERIPFGDGYGAWQEEKAQRMRDGKEFWYLGA